MAKWLKFTLFFLGLFIISNSNFLKSGAFNTLDCNFFSKKTCTICFESYSYPYQARLACGHYFCSDCIISMVSLAAKEQSIVALRCPDPSCKRVISIGDVKKMGFNSQIVDNLHRAMTPIERPEVDSETRRWLDFNTKPCPGCNRNIEKIKGCDHMTCSSCAYEFCWVCLEPRKSYFNHVCDNERLTRRISVARNEENSNLDKVIGVLLIGSVISCIAYKAYVDKFHAKSQ